MLTLELLQHRRDIATRKDVTRQQQHRQAIDRSSSRTGNHVGRAGSDARRADQCLQAIFDLSVRGCGVHHALLVAALIVAEIEILLERLRDASDVAVSKDAKAPAKKCVALAVSFDVLIFEEFDSRLRGCQANRFVCHDRSNMSFSTQ